MIESKSGKNEHFKYFSCMFLGGTVGGVWLVVGRPCPPIRIDIVTPRHLFHATQPYKLLLDRLVGPSVGPSVSRFVRHNCQFRAAARITCSVYLISMITFCHVFQASLF